MLDAFEDKIEELIDRLELLVGTLMGMGLPVRTRPFTTERTDEERRTTLDVLPDIGFIVKGLVEAQKECGPSLETSAVETGVRIPKIEVPTFNGKVLEWNLFWERFEVSVHSKIHISDAEKFAYFRQAVKDSPARRGIEGLAHSATNYVNAVEFLHRRYDKPPQTHKAHVRAIVEAASVKDGTGKELQ